MATTGSRVEGKLMIVYAELAGMPMETFKAFVTDLDRGTCDKVHWEGTTLEDYQAYLDELRTNIGTETIAGAKEMVDHFNSSTLSLENVQAKMDKVDELDNDTIFFIQLILLRWGKILGW